MRAGYTNKILLIFLILIQGCMNGGEGSSVGNSYADRLKKAEEFYDAGQKRYHEAKSIGSEHEAYAGTLKEAYRLGDSAMAILNKLEEEFGHRTVPEGEVLAHRALMQKLAKFMAEVVRMMPVGE